MIKKTKENFYMLIALLLAAQPVLADPEDVYSDLTAEEMAVLADPDLSEAEIIELKKKWKCKYCPDASEEPWYLQIDTGLGYVSNDSYQFGQYNEIGRAHV